MKKFLKWTFVALAAVVVGVVAKNVYDQVTTPILEADQSAAADALTAASEAAEGTGITVGGLLYGTSDERVAFMPTPKADTEAMSAAA